MLFRWKPVYIDWTQEDADKFTDYYKRMEEQLIWYKMVERKKTFPFNLFN